MLPFRESQIEGAGRGVRLCQDYRLFVFLGLGGRFLDDNLRVFGFVGRFFVSHCRFFVLRLIDLASFRRSLRGLLIAAATSGQSEG
jgi:hypothetical protein